MRKQTVEVSGRPRPANVTSKVVSMYKDKYMMEWMVDSLFSIEECRILYRRALVCTYHPCNIYNSELTFQGISDWTNIILTKKQKSNRFTFTFHDLIMDSEYEVIIQSRNTEGWSKPSHIFKFRTQAEGE